MLREEEDPRIVNSNSVHKSSEHSSKSNTKNRSLNNVRAMILKIISEKLMSKFIYSDKRAQQTD